MRSRFWFTNAGLAVALCVVLGIWCDDRVGTLAYKLMSTLFFVVLPWCFVHGFLAFHHEERARKQALTPAYARRG